ncbi:MAG: sporulation protein YqfC [Clostridiaceae bacterium]|nr:sporulation protein YqfC [Clostridiaceae bacterium]
MAVKSSKKNRRSAAGKDDKEEIVKKGAKERFVEMLELPKELVLDRPKLTMVGNCDIMIENYKGVAEYSSDRLRINTGSGIVRIVGTGLIIREITSEDIIVSGTIHTLEFVNAG